jgi:hypothetical protein
MADQEAQEKERRDRIFDLLKHVSTLNVAALVLVLALLRDFNPIILPGAEVVPLLFFGGSLLISMFGLFLPPLGGGHLVLAVAAIGLSYLTFLSGVLALIFVGMAAL